MNNNQETKLVAHSEQNGNYSPPLLRPGLGIGAPTGGCVWARHASPIWRGPRNVWIWRFGSPDVRATHASPLRHGAVSNGQPPDPRSPVGVAHVRPANPRRPDDRWRALCPEGAPWRAPTTCGGVSSYAECTDLHRTDCRHETAPRIHHERRIEPPRRKLHASRGWNGLLTDPNQTWS